MLPTWNWGRWNFQRGNRNTCIFKSFSLLIQVWAIHFTTLVLSLIYSLTDPTANHMQPTLITNNIQVEKLTTCSTLLHVFLPSWYSYVHVSSLPFYQLLFSPSSKSLHTPAKQPPSQRQYSVGPPWLAQVCSRFICSTKCHRNRAGKTASGFIGSWLSCGHRYRFSIPFSVVMPWIFAPRTPFSRAMSLVFRCLRLNKIYGTTWTRAPFKQLAQRFSHSLQYLTWWHKSNRMWRRLRKLRQLKYFC